jgi:capsid portal protein
MIVRDSKHFRTYLQVTSAYSEGDTTIHDARWFKEYRDPRVIDNTNGEVVPYSKQMNWDGSGNPMPEERKASEIYHFGGSDRSPYGIPRWASAIGSVLGARSGELVNLHTIQSNGVPSMMVTVSNGRLTEGTINRIQKYVDEHAKGSADYSTFLILEGEGDIAGDETNQVKISVTPMADAQVREMLFGTYIATNEARIMKAFRLSSIYLGDVAAFNKSTADVSRRLVEEQVFAPERDEDDWFFNDVLLAEWGVKHWRFVTNTPNITDNKDLIAMLVSAERTGGVTPRIARGIMAEVYPRLLESGDAKDPVGVELDTPFSLQIAKAVQSQANVVEPNQTGPPVMPPMDPSDAFKRLEKALFGVDELLEAEVRRYLTMSEDDAE